ncbi:uncharacterized protein BX664DRAFT_361085 [Halteromyces radiatus]|uniref:uncharacterized protein n=1 Tax=Halteromyces radiatus TaxID=101107 RepID=UPI00221E4186|nr:uncharacterized protein BX664DRAFT_361085 [Halteromyces radiatus]KAI8082789.1 hypothetical protein BX664DRAFT_361085 [Halteromyces radiatus]
MTALPGYGSSNGLELDGMTTMKILDGAPNSSQPMCTGTSEDLFSFLPAWLVILSYDVGFFKIISLMALDLVEDDWCLGSFMNLEAGSSAQAVLGSPANCATYFDGLKMSDVLLVATLLSLRTRDDDDIQLQYDIKHPLVLTRYYDCRLYNQISKLSGKKKMINQYYIQSLASFSLFFFFRSFLLLYGD